MKSETKVDGKYVAHELSSDEKNNQSKNKISANLIKP